MKLSKKIYLSSGISLEVASMWKIMDVAHGLSITIPK